MTGDHMTADHTGPDRTSPDDETPGAVFRLHLHADGAVALPYASPDLARILGVRADDLIADPGLIQRAVHPLDRPAYDESGRVAVERLQTFRWEGRMVRPGGEVRWVSITSRPARHPDGVTHWYGVVVDRTTRVRRSAQDVVEGGAEAGDAGGGDPLAIVAHEIGTPLTAIGMAADLARQVMEDPAVPAAEREAELVRCLRIVQQNVSLLASLRDGLLRGASDGSRRVVANPAAVLLRPHLDAAIALVQEPERVEVDCPPDLVCWVQPSHLDQMLINLLVNADKYAGGAVALRVRTGGDAVTITVEDRGPGVPEAFRGRLFSPYARAEATDDQPGSGLGLAIVADLAHANAGAVTYAPGPRGGSRFTVTLPLTPSPVSHC